MSSPLLTNCALCGRLGCLSSNSYSSLTDTCLSRQWCSLRCRSGRAVCHFWQYWTRYWWITFRRVCFTQWRRTGKNLLWTDYYYSISSDTNSFANLSLLSLVVRTACYSLTWMMGMTAFRRSICNCLHECRRCAFRESAISSALKIRLN